MTNQSPRDRVEPKSGKAWLINTGQEITVFDVDGEQVADFVAFNPADTSEYLSQARTRLNNWKARISTGDILYSNRNTPMFTILTDTVGIHDLLFPPCSAQVLKDVLERSGHQTGCQDHLAGALAEYGVDPQLVTDPFNLFMNSELDETQGLVVKKPISAPGDHIVLRAEGDWVAAVSACSDDVTDCNGGVCTAIDVSISDGAPSSA